MKIGVNTRLLLPGTLEGIGRFTHEILSRMVQDHPEDEFYFFFDRNFDSKYIYAPNVVPVVIHPKARSPLHWYWWFENALPKRLKKYDIDVFLSPELYNSISSEIPSLMVAHDIAYYHFPTHFPWYHLWYLKKYTPLFLQSADKVCCVSHSTKEDLSAVFGLPQSKLFVAGNGPTPGFEPLDETSKKKVRNEIAEGHPYFIYLGSIHPRKNIQNLIKGFEIFKNRAKDAPHKLVLVGRMAWKSDPIKESILQSPYHIDILHVGQREDAAEILSGAEALLYVSVLEGFGLPILEAFATQTPVITSNLGAMKEVAGEAACLINPTDVEEIAQGMYKIVTEDSYAKKLVEKGMRRLQDYDWSESARLIYNELDKLKDRE